MKKTALYLTVLLLIIFNSNSYSQETKERFGEKLTKEFWSVLKSGEIDSFAPRISDEYIALHQYGAGRKQDEIKLIKTIKLGEYKLTDFTESKIGSTIIVTYKVSGDEELGGREIKPAYRMTIWQNINNVWILAAHCNMSPLSENEK